MNKFVFMNVIIYTAANYITEPKMVVKTKSQNNQPN